MLSIVSVHDEDGNPIFEPGKSLVPDSPAFLRIAFSDSITATIINDSFAGCGARISAYIYAGNEQLAFCRYGSMDKPSDWESSIDLFRWAEHLSLIKAALGYSLYTLQDQQKRRNDL